MEPRASTPSRRLRVIQAIRAAGIPVGVMAAPVIPGHNDHEIPRILSAADDDGAVSAAWTLLRLTAPLDSLFDQWLAQHYPERRRRVLHSIRECRDGEVSDSRFGRRMRGEGTYAEHIAALFENATGKHGLDNVQPRLNADAFQRPPQPGDQLSLSF